MFDFILDVLIFRLLFRRGSNEGSFKGLLRTASAAIVLFLVIGLAFYLAVKIRDFSN
jgi:hypothetical protein